MTLFWVVTSCRLVEVYRRFRGACCPPQKGTHRPDDGGNKHLWNVGELLPDYTALQPRRQPSSYSPPWEPEISIRHELFSSWGSGFNSSAVYVACLWREWNGVGFLTLLFDPVIPSMISIHLILSLRHAAGPDSPHNIKTFDTTDAALGCTHSKWHLLVNLPLQLLLTALLSLGDLHWLPRISRNVALKIGFVSDRSHISRLFQK
jgi:hypothetical protein